MELVAFYVRDEEEALQLPCFMASVLFVGPVRI